MELLDQLKGLFANAANLLLMHILFQFVKSCINFTNAGFHCISRVSTESCSGASVACYTALRFICRWSRNSHALQLKLAVSDICVTVNSYAIL